MIPILSRRRIHLNIYPKSFSSILCCLPLHSFLSLSTVPTSSSLSLRYESDLFLLDYLTTNFGLAADKIRSRRQRLPLIQKRERPDSVVSLFKEYGFSESDIRKVVNVFPKVLFLDRNKILKPKIEHLLQLGFSGPQLGTLISKHPNLLSCSLEKRLAPSTAILRQFLPIEDVKLVLNRCKFIVTEDPNLKLVPNIAFLRDYCGIAGSQLAMLIRRQPSLFITNQQYLPELVRRTIEMGCSVNTQMFVHCLSAMGCVSPVTLRKKIDFIRSYGFSDEEVKQLFKNSPFCIAISIEKLQAALEFYLNEAGAKQSELVRNPCCLNYSMKKRIAPRYRVVQILNSKKLLKKGTPIVSLMCSSEEYFLKKYILRFQDDAAELLTAYQSDAAPL